MNQLHRLTYHPRSKKRPKRVGRGVGSGLGKTSGRGHKGQKQHGKAPRPGFEGGQMPLIRTTPKRGFSARSKVRYQILNVNDLTPINEKPILDPETLYEHDFISKRRVPLKILGEGELKQPLHIKAHAFSKSARAKIEKAGGKFEILGKG